MDSHSPDDRVVRGMAFRIIKPSVKAGMTSRPAASTHRQLVSGISSRKSHGLKMFRRGLHPIS